MTALPKLLSRMTALPAVSRFGPKLLSTYPLGMVHPSLMAANDLVLIFCTTLPSAAKPCLALLHLHQITLNVSLARIDGCD